MEKVKSTILVAIGAAIAAAAFGFFATVGFALVGALAIATLLGAGFTTAVSFFARKQHRQEA